uniref:Uncharacterized protein n=2 Tax=Kuenenia stuttgartiensis TaxID=174633 RepID=Q1PVE7_KUEST|nr:unknown protein [Candidatus Kuenenia stuttgartiensis]
MFHERQNYITPSGLIMGFLYNFYNHFIPSGLLEFFKELKCYKKSLIRGTKAPDIFIFQKTKALRF